MPLGTVALSENETDKDPSRVMQLAVDNDGIISGMMFNKTNQPKESDPAPRLDSDEG